MSFVCALSCATLGTGCGSGVDQPSVNTLIPADCSDATGAKIVAADVVYLDWSGGRTRIYPDNDMPGLNLALFETPDGGSLADRADEFKNAVRDEVSKILCDMPTDGIHLTSARVGLPKDHTRVCFAQVESPIGGGQIGEGEYDPCNQFNDNDAIIFGEALVNLGGPFAFEEWVSIFSNVTAHEIGHMLGYPHVPRVIYSPSQRPAFVELMMATHTVDEMIAAQRYLSDVENCPSAVAKSNDLAVYSCGHE